MLKYSIVFLSLHLFSQACFAEEDQVELQFVTFPEVANAEPVELLIGKGEVIKIELPTNALSPVYKVNRLSQWALGKSSIGADEEFAFDIYGKAASLASSKQLILVIRRGEKVLDGLELILMDNKDSKFGGGMYFFMNAAKVDIAVKVGDKKFGLKPRKYKLVDPKPSRTKGSRKYLNIKIYFRKGDNFQDFYANILRYSDRARNMMFIYHDPHTKQFRTHTIRNYPQR